nr:N-acetyl-D-Glu racemase DgcA [Tsuneonella aeria]
MNRPFHISRGVKTAAEVITVELHEDGFVGRGEGVPYPRYGESPGRALAEIADVRDAVERGASREELARFMKAGAARNALDCALWDLEARRSGQSVAELLGAPPLAPLPTALTIVIGTPAVMAAEASRVADAPLIKVKVNADNPLAAIRAVRGAAPNAALIVDPNESWDEALVRAAMPALATLGVAVLEQPCPTDGDAWMEGYSGPVPICADESVHTLADLEIVARRYQAINIKLDKTGGLTAALELAAAARARGMGLMSGCMVCSSLGIAPALHVARLSDWADLDGPLWLAEDRPGGVSERGGIMHPPAEGFWG